MNGQLAQLEMHDPRTEHLTTNGSELHTGFYLLLDYDVMGPVISTPGAAEVCGNYMISITYSHCKLIQPTCSFSAHFPKDVATYPRLRNDIL